MILNRATLLSAKLLCLFLVSACANNSNAPLAKDSATSASGFSCSAAPAVVSARNGELVTIQITVVGATTTPTYLSSLLLTTNPATTVNNVQVLSETSLSISRAYSATSALSFQGGIDLVDGSAAVNSSAPRTHCSFQVDLQP